MPPSCAQAFGRVSVAPGGERPTWGKRDVISPIDLLCYASSAGALIGCGSYVYGYVIKSKGDRRLHTASLLFSGFGMANLPIVLREGATGGAVLSAYVVVIFLLLGLICQCLTAFRGRRSDRRAGDRRQGDRATDARPEAAAAPALKAEHQAA